jgi:uncharacterized protein (DUF1015 family)
MKTLIKPFRGLRPQPDRAADVAAPPYDVLGTDEARAQAAGKPYSFLHISKPEIDLPPETDPYAPEVYAKGAENFRALIDQGVLIRDESPRYYVYRLTMGDHVQTGLVCAGNVADYDINRIRKHEFTRPKKEDDRVRQITALEAQTGPVLLVFRNADEVSSIFDEVTKAEPVYELVTENGVGHALWVVDDPSAIERLTHTFDAMDALYIADGHHRSAAASRVAAARKAANPNDSGEEDYNTFLCVAFPHDETQILDYNRVVRDLNKHTVAGLLERIAGPFTVTPVNAAAHPGHPGQFGMYLDGQWYRLEIRPDLIPTGDPVASLSASLLQDHLIGPMLGVDNPRTDERIDFVGGIRGLDVLKLRVDSGEMEIAFALYPTSMADVMAVADADEVMPPKSTWFEPKLADGLVSLLLD